ncbi:MAG: hypothetical protein M1422_04405 [Candidatus Thermoplasmatota archaeon]|nr:hypothetical protein [Candidatus Sysuiplasma jiujiangense]MBX8639539.1 hypothetical protein [Candidatus Sysuiplasma jiujiangense]MCL4317496.1 hypothetical protein [Candidatus Thermoplasmatota archaeon]MCL5254028.1 hypothetical protein [Candidatus Thermoplasmatota archaeon]
MQCEDCQMPVELIDLKRFSDLMNPRGYVILCRDCSEGRGLKWEKGKLCEPSPDE